MPDPLNTGSNASSATNATQNGGAFRHDNHEVFKLFIERAPAAIAMLDTEMRYLIVSRRFLTDLGLANTPPEALIGRSHYDVFPDIPDRWREIHRRVLAGETLSSEEDVYPRADGQTDWIRWEMTPWRRPNGSVGGAMIFSEVITTRKKGELALTESEDRLRLAQRAAGIGVFDWDMQTGRVIWNEEQYRIFGVAPGHFEGTFDAIAQQVLPDERDRVQAAVADATHRRAKLLDFDFRIRRPDGAVRCIEGSGSFEYDAEGAPQRMVGVNIDVTERRRTESALTEASARKAFLLRVSDALRTISDPAMAQKTVCQILSEHLSADRCYFSDIHAAKGFAVIRLGHSRKDLPPIEGRLELADFVQVVAMLELGAPVAIADTEVAPSLSHSTRGAFRQLSVRSFAAVPLVRSGRLVWTMSLSSVAPRAWTDAEIGLLKEVADRCWEAAERARANQELRASEDRQTFLLTLSDALRPLGDVGTVQAVACEALARHLAVERAFYLEVDEAAGIVRVTREALRGDLPSLVGEHRLADFPWSAKTLRTGDCLVVSDARSAPTLPVAERASLSALGLVAGITAPLVRDGYLVCALCVADGRPREWSEADVQLLREVGDRTWAASQQARAEGRLRESEADYRTLFVSLDEAVIVLDRMPQYLGSLRDWRCVALNPASKRLFGVGDLTGQPVRENLPVVDEGWYDICDRALEIGEVSRVEREVPQLAMTLQLYAARVGPPERQRIMIVMQDVTARRRTEQALRDREIFLMSQKDAFQAAVNGAPLDAVLEILAHSAAEQMGDGLRCAFYVADHHHGRLRHVVGMFEPCAACAPFFQIAPAAPGCGLSAFTRQPIITPDVRGDPRWSPWRWLSERHGFRALWSFPLETSAGRVVGVFAMYFTSPRSPSDRDQTLAQRLAQSAAIIISRDEERTERARAEATLRHSQKMEAIGQLTGGIAHDFNNMLQGVIGGLHMAGRRLEGGKLDDVPHYMQAAQDAALRAAGLTRRLLAFARRQQLEPRYLNMDTVIAGLDDMLRRVMGPAITIELRLHHSKDEVLCDPSELENALLNLCINARDAMPDGGRLIITTDDVELSEADLLPGEHAAPGGYVLVRIVDTGTGMPPEVLERASEPFFTTKPPGEGTGLGLSQVYGFVHQSAGVLRIESEPGRGTTMRIFLPRTAPQSASKAAAAEAEIPTAAKLSATLLLVDDETAVRKPAADHLRDLGYTVAEAADGAAALRLLDDGLCPELLVTDVGLPGGMDGRTLATMVRERLPGLPVLFITGFAHVPLPENVAVIAKPFGLDLLAHRIADTLARLQ